MNNMKKKIHLNILSLKNFTDEDLSVIQNEIEKIKIEFDNLLREPFSELKRKIRIEQEKRKRRNWVWVEFTCSWSGYSNSISAPRRDIAKEYRKINKDMADKMPNYFSHKFSDNSTNDWFIRIVSIKGKEQKNYSQQVDDFLTNLK